jgi:hypothetical protein
MEEVEMTRVFAFSGGAMAPTLGTEEDSRRKGGGGGEEIGRIRRGDASASALLYILARRLAHPFRSVSVGDVVAFTHPLDSSRTLVRRVSAVEGDELVDVINASVYVVPKDHAWLTADADADVVATVGGKTTNRHEDSRSFGPIDMRAIEWRVMYSLRNSVDHGEVVNSAEGHVADAPVLEAELPKAKALILD